MDKKFLGRLHGFRSNVMFRMDCIALKIIAMF